MLYPIIRHSSQRAHTYIDASANVSGSLKRHAVRGSEDIYASRKPMTLRAHGERERERESRSFSRRGCMCALSPLHGYSELCYLMRCAPRNIANKRRGSLNLGLFSEGGRGGERGSFNEGYLRLIYTWSPAHRARWERERERGKSVGIGD